MGDRRVERKKSRDAPWIGGQKSRDAPWIGGSDSGGDGAGSGSSTDPVREITKILKDNQDIQVIGLHGSRDQLNDFLRKQLKLSKSFGWSDVTVTEPVSPKRIQIQIGKSLNIFDANATIDDKAPEGCFLFCKTRKSTIRSKLKKEETSRIKNEIMKREKILLVLRDIQQRIDLSEVGIPIGHGRCCKILLTSEHEAVLRQYENMNIKLFRV